MSRKNRDADLLQVKLLVEDLKSAIGQIRRVKFKAAMNPAMN